jgi:uncharacterized membrane protein
MVQMLSVVSIVMNILHSVKYQINCTHVTVIFSHVPHNDVSVNDRPHIRRWSHNILVLTIVLQLPPVFSTVTCCTGL